MSIIEKALAKQKNKMEVTVDDESQQASNEVSVGKIKKPSNNRTLTLDIENLNQRGFLVDNANRKSVNEEFRQIKRKLLTNAFGLASKTLNHSNLIMISSSKPNEGKTFVSINLALSIALEQDKTVLLIDADVLRPSIDRELGFETNSGLVEYLLGEEDDISNTICSTNIEKLKIIPAGQPHYLSNELLASDRMVSLASELANRYPDRIVIFDSPPLIGVSETLVLANLMGQALIVVEESKTLLSDINKATENLNEDLAIGLILNKAIRSHKDLYGYYGYGYGTKN